MIDDVKDTAHSLQKQTLQLLIQRCNYILTSGEYWRLSIFDKIDWQKEADFLLDNPFYVYGRDHEKMHKEFLAVRSIVADFVK